MNYFVILVIGIIIEKKMTNMGIRLVKEDNLPDSQIDKLYLI